MHALITAITDWPALAQGVAGAAIFWLLVTLGTKTYNFCSSRVIGMSRKTQMSRLLSELFRAQAYKAAESNDDVRHTGMFAAVLWYRASRHFVKAIIWQTLGLVFYSFLPALGVVGFIGCLYYLLSTFQVVRPFSGPFDVDSRISELEKQIDELKSRHGS